MSNIPSSAIPHAWARDDEADAGSPQRRARAAPPSFAALAGIGAVLLYLVYRVAR